MTGSEHSLDVYVGKSPIAKLTLRNDQLLWQYNQKWQQTGYAVSPHLPLNNDIPPINVQRFLRNLLPEGNALDELVSCFQLSKYNTYALIRALGLDISGALIILPTGENYPKNGSFREISDAELIARLEQKDNRSLLIWDGKPRLSVAGVQDKINVVINQEGQMGFGEGALCSTHILKFEKRKLSHLVLNEYITMQLAKHCGLTVANVNLKYFGEHPTLLVERFDRQLISQSSVKRRHVIDGCQAVNVSPEYKYERNFGSARDVAHIRDGVSYAKLFEFTDNCSNPALTKQKILDWALFNALIFNYDAHGKNISFFVGAKGITLAPFYDLVNIGMYPEFAQDMAMALGDEFNANTVNAYQLADFADSCDFPRGMLVRRLQHIIKKLHIAINLDFKALTTNQEGVDYLQKYQAMVNARCEHFLSQASQIPSIAL